MIAKASASFWPCPKNAGAEPIPPKLPQPSATRGIVRAELPSGRLFSRAAIIRRRCQELPSAH